MERFGRKSFVGANTVFLSQNKFITEFGYKIITLYPPSITSGTENSTKRTTWYEAHISYFKYDINLSLIKRSTYLLAHWAKKLVPVRSVSERGF